MSKFSAVSYLKDMFRRLKRNWGWVVAQFAGNILLILAVLAWTRLPGKHVWQVALTLLVPLLLAISAVELQAATMRAFADDDRRRVKLVFGAMSLLVWIALGWVAWRLLDWFDGQIPLWPGYLNSRISPRSRATMFTFTHIQHWLTILEWVLRWIVVPGKLIPFAIATSLWGWRAPWVRTFRILWSWRWWPAAVLTALASVAMPAWFFAGLPHGTVSAQIWSVSLKLAASYILAVISWILLLAWAAVLLTAAAKPADAGSHLAPENVDDPVRHP